MSPDPSSNGSSLGHVYKLLEELRSDQQETAGALIAFTAQLTVTNKVAREARDAAARTEALVLDVAKQLNVQVEAHRERLDSLSEEDTKTRQIALAARKSAERKSASYKRVLAVLSTIGKALAAIAVALTILATAARELRSSPAAPPPLPAAR